MLPDRVGAVARGRGALDRPLLALDRLPPEERLLLLALEPLLLEPLLTLPPERLEALESPPLEPPWFRVGWANISGAIKSRPPKTRQLASRRPFPLNMSWCRIMLLLVP